MQVACEGEGVGKFCMSCLHSVHSAVHVCLCCLKLLRLMLTSSQDKYVDVDVTKPIDHFNFRQTLETYPIGERLFACLA